MCFVDKKDAAAYPLRCNGFKRIFPQSAANRDFNGKASGKVGAYRSRPARRFSQLQFDDLLVQQNIFFSYDPVCMVMSEKLIFKLTPLGHFLQEIG